MQLKCKKSTIEPSPANAVSHSTRIDQRQHLRPGAPQPARARGRFEAMRRQSWGATGPARAWRAPRCGCAWRCRRSPTPCARSNAMSGSERSRRRRSISVASRSSSRTAGTRCAPRGTSRKWHHGPVPRVSAVSWSIPISTPFKSKLQKYWRSPGSHTGACSAGYCVRAAANWSTAARSRHRMSMSRAGSSTPWSRAAAVPTNR